jgi:uncharacterized 2Fe-2S/4Fe-4S cluster protein (DUF4445 family)
LAQTDEIVLLNDFRLEPDHDKIFHLLNCNPESPVYEEMNQIYEELLPEVLKLAVPKGALCFTRVRKDFACANLPENSAVLFLIVTVGKELSMLSNRYFREGDYPRGMMADAMADGCVFSMENTVLPAIREECRKRHVGIRHRYEAPVDVPMEMQKTAFDAIHAGENLQMSITSGFMLDPVKSNCQVFGITEDESMFQLEHDCRKCPRLTCPLRNIPPVRVEALCGSVRKNMVCRDGETLLQALAENGIHLNAPCGGKGKCGKCGVRVVNGFLPETDEDRKFFTKKELSDGWRLACCARPSEDLEVFAPVYGESEFAVQTGFASAKTTPDGVKSSRLGIAIDIGTTTVVAALTDPESGKIIGSWSSINPQRVFGADVISRIQASNEGHGEELQKLIREELAKGIRFLCTQHEADKTMIQKIVIAGNTTMGHLLLGFSCRSLGVVPFTPVDISRMKKIYCEVFADDFLPPETEVVFMPGISTYVGGDITSGFFSCGFQDSTKVCALIDLGTNGEMGIGTGGKILVTSTAAGPAFEGGNIQWGTGSIPGAICGIKIPGGAENRPEITTIGNRKPIGICGTGVIETASELLRNSLIDETGILVRPYFDEGFPLAETPDGKKIIFTEKDVREIQLAKAAVRAGFETLLYRYGVTYDQVDTLYLAGGFGYRIDREKAVGIGMLPEQLLRKTVAVGNTSLGGAVRYLTETSSGETVDRIVSHAEEIDLAKDKKFNEYYMDYMLFGEE